MLKRGPEVAGLGVPRLREQDVSRLDIAVDQPVLERVLERAYAFEDDLDDFVEGKQSGDMRVHLERGAGHVLHHQIAVLGLDHGVEDLDDVRMVELASERRLGKERLVHHALGLRIDVVGEQEHLDGDVPVGEGVARKINAAGRSAADLPNDRVFAQVLLELELHRHRPRVPEECEGSAESRARRYPGSLNGFSKSVLAVSSSMLQAVPDPDGEPVQQLARRSARPRARRGLGIRVPRGLDRRILEVVLLRARVNVAVAFVHGDAVLKGHGVSFLWYGAVHYTDMVMNRMLFK